jgi:hypothetical protein
MKSQSSINGGSHGRYRGLNHFCTSVLNLPIIKAQIAMGF